MARERQRRSLERATFRPEDRMVLIEGDADDNDAEHDSMRADIKGMKTMLVSILITLAVSSLLLAANLAVGGLGS